MANDVDLLRSQFTKEYRRNYFTLKYVYHVVVTPQLTLVYYNGGLLHDTSGVT